MTTSPGWLTGFHCDGGVHFFVGASSVCQCGVKAATPPGPYGLLAGYKPGAAPVAPKVPEPEIPARRKILAKWAGASHISADGTRAFVIRFGECHQTNWDGNEWGRWWSMGGDMLPGGVVEVK